MFSVSSYCHQSRPNDYLTLTRVTMMGSVRLRPLPRWHMSGTLLWQVGPYIAPTPSWTGSCNLVNSTSAADGKLFWYNFLWFLKDRRTCVHIRRSCRADPTKTRSGASNEPKLRPLSHNPAGLYCLQGISCYGKTSLHAYWSLDILLWFNHTGLLDIISWIHVLWRAS